MQGDYRQLAARLAGHWKSARPGAVGLGGGQGAGKSTLSRMIVEACGAEGLRCASLSLDDYYLSRAEREALAARVHPLFTTRGPPGTHDVERCGRDLRALRRPGEVRVPVFDKGLDDRAGERVLRGPFELVLLEGWCVGARPLGEAALAEPVNALEAERDPEGVWRRHGDVQLAGPYARLFAALDFLVFLRVPSLAAVRRWRLQQEGERPTGQRLSAAQVDHFVQHYERVTLAMLEDLPGRADVLVALDEAHGVSDVRWEARR